MYVNFNILNQLGSPSINSNTFANRPAAGQTGRLFVSTDTFEIYRDNGTTWDLIGGPGAGTITGSGTATQVAYFTGAQTIGSSANLFWDNTNTRLGIGTATPGVRLDIHGTGTLQQLNSTGATNNNYLAFQRSGTSVWRIGDTYNGGTNFFSLYNATNAIDAVIIYNSTNKGVYSARETIGTGLATGSLFNYQLNVPNGTTFGTPNAITALGMFTDISLLGSSTVPIGTRQGFDANQRLSFNVAGTMTVTQGSTVRAFSNLNTAWSFNGTQVGTVTHLAGMRIVFPDNIGSAINVTNNYGILINNQTTGLGTVNYTNRWGIYQEGASDTNYFAGKMLLNTTTDIGQQLVCNGLSTFTDQVTASITGLGFGFRTENAADTNNYVYMQPRLALPAIVINGVSGANTSSLTIRARPGSTYTEIVSGGTNNLYLSVSGGGNGTGQGLYLNSSAGANGNTRFLVDSIEVARISPYNLTISDSGTVTPNASAILQANSTTTGFLKPRMTTAQRNAIASPATGLEIFNTTTNQTEFYNGTTWTSPGGGLTQDIVTIAFAALGSSFKGSLVSNTSWNLSAPATSLVSQTIYFMSYYLPVATTITNINFYQTTSGNYTPSNYNGLGLYSYSAGTLTLVASTTNNGNLYSGFANQWRTIALSTPYSAAAGIYFIAVLHSSSANVTSPAVSSTTTVALGVAYDFTNNAKLLGQLTGQTALPATQSMAPIGTSNVALSVALS